MRANSSLQQFLDRVQPESKELEEDLSDLPLPTFNCKVGDFGCGYGYITWCLMQKIPNCNCTGIDKFDPYDPPTCDMYGKFTIDYIRSMYKPIDAEPYPDFQKYDIVTAENLPLGFDLIYCKRVLYNIYSNNGCTELSQTIHHIAGALKPNSWLCLVEIQNDSFNTILETLLRNDFEFNSPRKVYRPYITLGKTFEQRAYLIYHCRKSK